MTGPEPPASRTSGRRDGPAVWIHPPLLFAVLVAAGYALHRFAPLPLAPERWPWPGSWPGGGEEIAMALGVIFIALALFYAGAAFREFLKAGTAVPTFLPATALVTRGIYRFTRNPMYVAMILLFAAIGLVLNSLWFILLLAPLVVVLRYGVIAKEEAYLEAKFGEGYRRYKERVKRRF